MQLLITYTFIILVNGKEVADGHASNSVFINHPQEWGTYWEKEKQRLLQQFEERAKVKGAKLTFTDRCFIEWKGAE